MAIYWVVYTETERWELGELKSCKRIELSCDPVLGVAVERANIKLRSIHGRAWAHGKTLHVSVANGMSEEWFYQHGLGRQSRGRAVLEKEER